MHVVGGRLASLVKLVTLHERPWNWVILLEFEIARSLVVAEGTSDSEILWSCVKYNPGGLTDRRAHPDRTHVDGVVPAGQGHLKLEVIFVIFGLVCLLTHQLFLLYFWFWC